MVTMKLKILWLFLTIFRMGCVVKSEEDLEKHSEDIIPVDTNIFRPNIVINEEPATTIPPHLDHDNVNSHSIFKNESHANLSTDNINENYDKRHYEENYMYHPGTLTNSTQLDNNPIQITDESEGSGDGFNDNVTSPDNSNDNDEDNLRVEEIFNANTTVEDIFKNSDYKYPETEVNSTAPRNDIIERWLTAEKENYKLNNENSYDFDTNYTSISLDQNNEENLHSEMEKGTFRLPEQPNVSNVYDNNKSVDHEEKIHPEVEDQSPPLPERPSVSYDYDNKTVYHEEKIHPKVEDQSTPLPEQPSVSYDYDNKTVYHEEKVQSEITEQNSPLPRQSNISISHGNRTVNYEEKMHSETEKRNLLSGQLNTQKNVYENKTINHEEPNAPLSEQLNTDYKILSPQKSVHNYEPHRKSIDIHEQPSQVQENVNTVTETKIQQHFVHGNVISHVNNPVVESNPILNVQRNYSSSEQIPEEAVDQILNKNHAKNNEVVDNNSESIPIKISPEYVSITQSSFMDTTIMPNIIKTDNQNVSELNSVQDENNNTSVPELEEHDLGKPSMDEGSAESQISKPLTTVLSKETIISQTPTSTNSGETSAKPEKPLSTERSNQETTASIFLTTNNTLTTSIEKIKENNQSSKAEKVEEEKLSKMTLSENEKDFNVTTESRIAFIDDDDDVSITAKAIEDNILDYSYFDGRSHTDDGAVYASLILTMKLFVNNTRLYLPQNITVEENHVLENGDVSFKWEAAENLFNISGLFHIQPKNSYCSIDNIDITITKRTNIETFDHITEEPINVQANNLELFKTEQGVLYQTNGEIVLSMDNGVKIHLSNVEFFVAKDLKLSDNNNNNQSDVQSANAFADYYAELIGGGIGILLIAGVALFAFRKLRNSNESFKPNIG